MPEDTINRELNKLSKAFRKYLGHEIRMKNTPEIKFYQDEDIKHEENMLEVMKDLNTGKS
jgi:ribosome-binding factor A